MDKTPCKILFLQSIRDVDRISRAGSTLVSIESENPEFLKEAIKRKSTSFDFINPVLSRNFHRDRALIQLASDKKIPFEIPVSFLLRSYSLSRTKLIRQISSFLKICTKMRAKFIFTSRAANLSEMKSQREIQAIAISLFKISREQALKALSVK